MKGVIARVAIVYRTMERARQAWQRMGAPQNVTPLCYSGSLAGEGFDIVLVMDLPESELDTETLGHLRRHLAPGGLWLWQ